MVTGAEVKAEPENHATVQWSNFPAGLRLLVVDDDPLCLKVVEQMLRRCNYKVTTCTNATTALNVLREKNNEYDLVLSDVYMPDMDGFKLLEVVGLEMDLPVIMMSSNGDTSNVLRGVTHGACDYLIKPVRLEELRNLWQHVVRRRRQHVMDLDSDEQSQERDEECVAARNKRKAEGLAGVTDQGRAGNGAVLANGALGPGGAAAGAGLGTCGLGSSGLGNDDMLFENGSNKKARVVWSVEMHQQFVNAVNQLGIDKAVPKKILEIMNVDGLTRENVASHLQKYRLYLKRVAGQGGGHAQEKGQAAAGSGSGSGQQAQAAGQAAPAGQVTGQQGQGAGQSSRGGKGAAAQQAQQPAGVAAGAGASGAGGSAMGSGADPPAAGPGTGDSTAAAVAAAATGGFPNPMLPPNPMGLGVANPMGLMGNPAAAAAAAAAAGMSPLLGAMGGLGVGGLPGLSPLGPMPMPGMQPPLGMLPGLPGGPMPGLPALPGLPGLPGPMGALNPMNGLQQMAAANFMQGMASMGQLPGMGLNPAAGLMNAMAAGMGMAGGPAAQQQQALFPQPSAAAAVAAANAAAAAAASVPPPAPPQHLPAADGHLQGLPPAQQNPHGQHSLKRLQPPPGLDANARFQSMTLHAPGEAPSALPGAMPPMPLSATATANPSSTSALDPHDMHGPLDLPLPGDMVNGLLSDGAFVGPDEVDLGLGLGLGSGSGRGQPAPPQAAPGVPGAAGAGAAPGVLDPVPLLGSTDHEMAAVFGDMLYVEDASAATAAAVPGGGAGGGGLLGGDGLGLGLGPGGDPAKGLVVTDDDFFNFLLKG